MINLKLERLYLRPGYTIGKLYIDNVYFCDTLEDQTRDLNMDGDLDDEGEGKVFGETSIPYGRYHVEVTWSPKFKRLLPVVLGVYGFIGIRIHRGRWASHTQGCILVGENKIKGGLINSADYEIALTKRLHAEQISKRKIYINIV